MKDMHKMTDKEIEKALELCKDRGGCEECPYHEFVLGKRKCMDRLQGDALDYINRLKIRNEELKVTEQCLNVLTNCFCTEGDDEE